MVHPEFVTTAGGGMYLAPDEAKNVTLSAATDQLVQTGNEPAPRWFVAVEPGKYRVRARFAVDRSYFNSDSHWRLADYQREAARNQAEVWQSEVFSNEIEVKCRPVTPQPNRRRWPNPFAPFHAKAR